MKKIIYSDEATAKGLIKGKKSALINFETTLNLEVAISKTYSQEDARKGFEQLKRWCSTSAFEVIVLANFPAMLPFMDKAHVLEWLSDHASEWEFPTLVMVGECEDVDFLKLF